MNFIKQIERVQLLNRLIKEERTGSPDALAERLHLSRSQLYNLIDELKDMGVDIRYSRSKRSFYFKNNKYFQID
ncbi:MAG: HTH domain-containing protein, partial [Cyclobacteriaceae bacterium]